MMDGDFSFFGKQVNNYIRSYDNIRKNTIVKGDDHTIGCLLDYPYLKKHYKIMAIDLSNDSNRFK